MAITGTKKDFDPGGGSDEAGSAAWGDITGTLSDQTDLQTALDAKQPLDSDLTTIAGLTATTDNFIVSVASAWASRTPAQVKSTLSLNNVDNTSDATKNAASATLTNKTLTSPVISSISNTGTLTLPTSTDTLIGRATTDTLTNKTIDATGTGNSITHLGKSYVHFMSGLATNPADGSTQYFGGCVIQSNTTESFYRVYFPTATTIKTAIVGVLKGVAATNENVSVYIRLNATTDTTISTTWQWTTANGWDMVTATGLSIAVGAGEFIAIKIVCPTWSTNPTTIYYQCTLEVINNN